MAGTTSAECKSDVEEEIEAEIGKIEAETIVEHAGWVFKRVREILINGPAVHTIKITKTSKVQVEVNKVFIVSLLTQLGNDTLVQPGRFLFTPIPDVLEIFVYLHNVIEQFVKEKLETSPDKDILKKCLQFLSEDKELRELWKKVLGIGNNADDTVRAGSVILLQRVVTMFMKSKQQMI